MVSRGQLVDAMAVGYSPTCQSKPGLWPCYPIMPRFGLMGIGAYGQMIGRRYQNVVPVIPRYGMAGLGQDSTDTTDTSTAGLLTGFMSGGGSGMDWLFLAGLGLLVMFAGYSMFHTTKSGAQKVSKALGARGKRRRKAKAQKLREKAKQIEAGGGWFF